MWTCRNGGKISNNDIIRTYTTYASVDQFYFQVTSNLHMALQGKEFKQGYYRNINTISLCTPVLLSGNIQSKHVAAGEIFQTTILSEH